MKEVIETLQKAFLLAKREGVILESGSFEHAISKSSYNSVRTVVATDIVIQSKAMLERLE